jgi:putative transcriptional regulator
MNEKDFENLAESIKQAGQIKRGERQPSRTFRFAPADIKAIRGALRKSQPEFAMMIGVSVATLRNWEQGRRQPLGPARALLTIAAQDPDIVARTLGG